MLCTESFQIRRLALPLVYYISTSTSGIASSSAARPNSKQNLEFARACRKGNLMQTKYQYGIEGVPKTTNVEPKGSSPRSRLSQFSALRQPRVDFWRSIFRHWFLDSTRNLKVPQNTDMELKGPSPGPCPSPFSALGPPRVEFCIDCWTSSFRHLF